MSSIMRVSSITRAYNNQLSGGLNCAAYELMSTPSTPPAPIHKWWHHSLRIDFVFMTSHKWNIISFVNIMANWHEAFGAGPWRKCRGGGAYTAGADVRGGGVPSGRISDSVPHMSANCQVAGTLGVTIEWINKHMNAWRQQEASPRSGAGLAAALGSSYSPQRHGVCNTEEMWRSEAVTVFNCEKRRRRITGRGGENTNLSRSVLLECIAYLFWFKAPPMNVWKMLPE